MKKILFILMLFSPLSLYAQNLRCLTASSYNVIKNGGALTKVNKPISICFNDYYFSFYTPLTGTRTFRITNNSLDTLEHGYTRQRFMNDENETNMKGDYNVEVNYEKQKTVVISFTKFGEAYIVKAPNFAGSVEQRGSKYEPIKKAISERKKMDTTYNPNYKLNPQLRKMTAKMYIDIDKYVSNEMKWSGGKGEVDVDIVIDKDGSLTATLIGSSLPTQKDKDEITNGVFAALKNMPKWTPPYDEYGLPKREHGRLIVHLSE